MESKKEKDLKEGSIFDKYIIIKKADEGGFAKVYLAEERETKKQYAIKVLKKNKTPGIVINSFLREIEILKILSNSDKTNNYTPHIYYYGKGCIKEGENNIEQKYYYVMDYFPKKDLCEYIINVKKTKIDFKEKHAKVIFSKILKGVKFCHDAGICHLDLHLKNIIFNEKYDPKIIDFSFSLELKYADKSGMFNKWEWPKIRCPEILEKHRFNGIKVDIFSLGMMLFNIVTKYNGFEPEFKDKINKLKYYSLIKEGKIEKYWNIVAKEIPKLSSYSEEFKKLFISMVSYDPEKRPTIEEILKDPWFEEINSLNKEEYQKLEEEIIEIFMKLENEMNKENEIYEKKGEKSEDKDTDNEDSGNRSCNDKIKQYFDLNLTPKYIYQKGLNAKNYIIIKGNLHPAKFLNNLLNKICEEFMDICFIEEDKHKLKFNITFDKQEEDENEEDNDKDEELDNLIEENCTICIKLFEYINGGYELHFIRKSGNLEDYYEYFNKIKQIIKKLLM